MQNEIPGKFELNEIVGESSTLKRALWQARDAARTDAAVLILGETGSGKELIARSIHRMGNRRGQSFIKVDCSIVAYRQLETDLFGIDGGRLEAANRGTFLLKGAESVSKGLQSKLLRVFEQKRLARPRNATTVSVDARLIATVTNVGKRVEDFWLHKGLSPHLSLLAIRVPALRERKDDIPLLAQFFLKKWARRMNKSVDTLSADTMTALVNYSWPHNVRELENVIEQSLMLTSEGHELRLSTPLKGEKRA
jgi:formate hydrogenlyase transcriptional activator